MAPVWPKVPLRKGDRFVFDDGGFYEILDRATADSFFVRADSDETEEWHVDEFAERAGSAEAVRVYRAEQ